MPKPFGELFEFAGPGAFRIRGAGRGPGEFVLVHGIGASAAYFRPLAERLSAAGRVHVIELPGHGKKLEPKRPLSMGEFARATWRVLDSVCGESPMLVGHSMGTQVVVEMALQRPGIRKAALLAPTVNERERTVPRQALRLLQDGLIEPWGLKAILARDYALCGPRWWALTLGEMMAHRIEERISHVEADLLIVAGEKDPTSPPAWARQLERAAPRARTAVIKGAPHSLMYRDADEVARLLLEHAGAPVGS